MATRLGFIATATQTAFRGLEEKVQEHSVAQQDQMASDATQIISNLESAKAAKDLAVKNAAQARQDAIAAEVSTRNAEIAELLGTADVIDTTDVLGLVAYANREDASAEGAHTTARALALSKVADYSAEVGSMAEFNI
jgi:hypothetical protein